MSPRALLAALWRRRFLALAVLLVMLAAVALGLYFAPKRYTAAATVTASPQQSLRSSAGNLDELEATLAHLVDTDSVLHAIQRNLGTHRPISVLRDEVSGQRVDGTVLIRITAQDSDPRVAAEIANAAADALPLHDPSGGLFLFTSNDRADPPTAFSSPDVKLLGAVGAVLGVVLAVAAALVRDAAARTVDSPGELRAASGADVLAVVPRPPDPAGMDVLDGDAAPFRAVRVALGIGHTDAVHHTLVVAPAVPDPSDQWFALNLAVALAQVGQRALVVDTQLGTQLDTQAGRPSRHPALTNEDGAPGLFDVLREAAALDTATIAGPVDGVSVLPVGDPGGEAAADLVEMHFHDLLAKLASGYDVVVLSAASPAVSDDARIMAVGGELVLVVPAGRVPAKTLTGIVDELRAVRTRVAGCVLVTSRRRRSGW